MQGVTVPELIVPYDPAMSRVCGGAAAALCFCYLEQQFLSGRLDPLNELRYTWLQMADRLGMRPSQFSKAFNKIGAVHRWPSEYRRNVLSGHEFWNPTLRRLAFYSMEVTEPKGITIVRRNARAIDEALCTGGHPSTKLPVMETGPKAKAQLDARRLLGL
jgi:hypothetical protein